jgi:transcriptional regulator with XRE-family HTH domain
MFAMQTVCVVDIGVASGTVLIAHTVAPECVEICSVNDQGSFYAEIGRRVRLARERLGLTQDSLATQVMLSRTSVTNIEKGRQKVLAHTICRLAGALNVLPAELLPDTPPLSEGEGEPPGKLVSPRAREMVAAKKKKRGKRPAHSG